ncbi:NAD(P)-dependent glycerol-3-phosphate dehydrogenase [bacterium]|jgi:glycerol-3-phosphate dehydrogenase (NAD(P)+)|nr:NAD(P)-dependent glycerol-3-phosphate dehydrogenase [bacterium]
MTKKDFWTNSRVAVIGAGSWGTVLAHLASLNCSEVRIWVRDDELAGQINATRVNKKYVPELTLNDRVRAYSDLEKVFDASSGVQCVIWALPSSVCRKESFRLAKHFRGDELVLHATKGIEEGTLKRVSEVLKEELPTPRIGVISGPNLAHEVASKQPAATVVASHFDEVVAAGQALLSSESFRVYPADDVIGVEWAGTLKNILAIASGALDAMGLGWNSRATLITRGLAEMVRFGMAMGANQSTFLGLAGVGDLLATGSSNLSRNYRVGMRLAKGEKLPDILKDLGSTAEGVRTTQTVYEFAQSRGIEMPITGAVYRLVKDGASIKELIPSLMARPSSAAEI